MQELIELGIDLFHDHWIKVAIGAGMLFLGSLFGWWRARKRWQKKEFFDRVNFSLNSLVDGKLLIRTLMETSCKAVFLNQVAVNQILTAAKQTTAADPIIPLAQDDYWFFLNGALNEVSEKFATGFLKRDLGASVQTGRYLLCLTNECDGDIRTRKIRVMLIQQQLLEKLPEEQPELESPNHSTRWKTLQAMSERYQSTPHQFLSVEILL
jgi:hypothetical protein